MHTDPQLNLRSVQVHDLFHGEPLAAFGGSGEANLAGIGERPPFVFGRGIVPDGCEIRLGVCPDVFKMAYKQLFPGDFGDMDVEVTDVRFGDGGADFRPDIGMEFAVFPLLLWAEFDDGAVVFHLRLGGGFGCRVGGAVDGFELFHDFERHSGQCRA